jgi:hypothetical protein
MGYVRLNGQDGLGQPTPVSWMRTLTPRGSDYGLGDLGLAAETRAAIEAAGYTVDCRIDPFWTPSPAGGAPEELCSIDGGPYEHSALALDATAWRIVDSLRAEVGPPGAAPATYAPLPATYAPPPVAAAPGARPQVTLTNLSRPGAGFQVGDQFLVRVAGTPGRSVSVVARQNGGDWSTSTYGQTNTQGVFELRGQMGADHVGRWEELWKTNGAESALLTFDVSFAAATVQPGHTQLPAPVGATPAPAPLPAGAGVMDLLQRRLFWGIPAWGLLAAAGGGLLLWRRGR